MGSNWRDEPAKWYEVVFVFAFMILVFVVIVITIGDAIYRGDLSWSNLANMLLIVALMFSLLRSSKLKSDLHDALVSGEEQ